MRRTNWVQAAVFGFVALLVLIIGASMLSPWMGWFGGMMGRGVVTGPGMMGPGMMGPGMMGGRGILGWLGMLLIPLAFLAVLVLGVVWLVQQVSPRQAGGGSAATAIPCPHCGRFVQMDWRACPYCGDALVASGPPPPA